MIYANIYITKMPRKTKSNITQQKWGENYANGRTYAEVISFWGRGAASSAPFL
jgi:hypothetical protein